MFFFKKKEATKILFKKKRERERKKRSAFILGKQKENPFDEIFLYFSATRRSGDPVRRLKGFSLVFCPWL
jgi:hypothetical protein